MLNPIEALLDTLKTRRAAIQARKPLSPHHRVQSFGNSLFVAFDDKGEATIVGFEHAASSDKDYWVPVYNGARIEAFPISFSQGKREALHSIDTAIAMIECSLAAKP